MSNQTPQRLTKNERREQAREQARVARAAEKAREKRSRLFIQGGVVLGVLAVLAIVGVVLTQTLKPAGPGPMNMSSGGVVFTKDLKVVKGDRLEDPAAPRIAPEVNRDDLPVDVTVYADYMCPACGAFEQKHGAMLENYVGSGDVQLESYPVNFLDGNSLGTKYSTRAANLLACVVDEQPDFAFALNARLLDPSVQPGQGTPGLDDKQLIKEAQAVGAEATNRLQSCVRDRQFAAFIDANREAAFSGIVGLAEGAQLIASVDQSSGAITMQDADKPQQLVSTPLVIVNGQQWYEPRDGSLESYILKVKGEIEQSKAGSGAEKSEEKTG